MVSGVVPRLFPLGDVVATPAAIQALAAAGSNPWLLVARHVRGDWGDLDEHDASMNVLAWLDGGRIFSAYNVGDSLRVWVITEADRSATTILLPEDY